MPKHFSFIFLFSFLFCFSNDFPEFNSQSKCAKSTIHWRDTLIVYICCVVKRGLAPVMTSLLLHNKFNDFFSITSCTEMSVVATQSRTKKIKFVQNNVLNKVFGSAFCHYSFGQNPGLIVRTCVFFLCFVIIMFVLSIILASLFSLFYVTRERNRF